MTACHGSSLPQTWGRLGLYKGRSAGWILTPTDLVIAYLLLLLVLIQFDCLLPLFLIVELSS